MGAGVYCGIVQLSPICKIAINYETQSSYRVILGDSKGVVSPALEEASG